MYIPPENPLILLDRRSHIIIGGEDPYAGYIQDRCLEVSSIYVFKSVQHPYCILHLK